MARHIRQSLQVLFAVTLVGGLAMVVLSPKVRRVGGLAPKGYADYSAARNNAVPRPCPVYGSTGEGCGIACEGIVAGEQMRLAPVQFPRDSHVDDAGSAFDCTRECRITRRLGTRHACNGASGGALCGVESK